MRCRKSLFVLCKTHTRIRNKSWTLNQEELVTMHKKNIGKSDLFNKIFRLLTLYIDILLYLCKYLVVIINIFC